MDAYAYLNGEFLPLAETRLQVTDLAFLRGYGIFDFLRVVKGHPIFVDDHLDRFEQAAKVMGLQMPESRECLQQLIAELIQLNPHELLGLKMILTGGYSADGFTPAEQPNLLAWASPFSFPDAALGVSLMSYEYHREIPGVKTLSYLPPIQMLPQLKRQATDDYLYYWNGLISESSRSNVFIVKNQTVSTAATGILPGITRKHVLSVCQGIFAVEERAIQLAEVFAADEVFITSSNQRIMPVRQIDQHVLPQPYPGPVTRKLQALFLEREGMQRVAVNR
ncbi:aminotransferase class IV [Spirosoma pollinicola]|uniref:branched-chain-amino-acid transaminase n=1 Tax=Spirosoma pollinicola TaxID=2057025 RepID=A0A2K8YTQ5_9BACT|nr:aminotransferase class IV [Spirosoma pollinicola]AUD01007.1 amino acid aminotransferase [Spirosoma pollinicola]